MNRLVEKITAIVEKLPNLKLLILFGSRARGEHRPDSDWDFAVLYGERSDRKDISSLLKIYTLLEQAFEIPDDKIDVVDLKECSPILAHYVARDGQLLYERETGLFEVFKEKFLMNPEESKALYRQLRNNLEISLREKGV
ncbi:MAG: nucleotidyltransferase domain-containing protein [Microcystis aeruginosa Ma_QC_Ch_20071001_S25]|jgi:predicted nucleotidyltransferase|uniref:Nucleotidyltransferase domain-containing protein n=2 Tax=Microcystis aeruginosa TaxID=1126 RepID=A0A552G1B6_MICAE|nr:MULTISPECIES: nucleotidyltransferase domain-containing protein [unclassified Microcystis]MCA2761334.1 nucleotidyltransferase domain-containing protein [Microcystis sp. M151S2]NCR15204.1 nucleotidyltransferase domain-containing protein [Microcystis aeruginosa SX13-11]NCR19629.1 nucleotidyltransferase domain-containing protein [Microcystis aeruginosa LL13-03]NCR46197.1 nucleotidyltransferase domain-containing protein [Microcystis aeruginosa SX13-01]NCR69054.1 nucleotidyltransferase domain-con